MGFQRQHSTGGRPGQASPDTEGKRVEKEFKRNRMLGNLTQVMSQAKGWGQVAYVRR